MDRNTLSPIGLTNAFFIRKEKNNSGYGKKKWGINGIYGI